MSQKPAYASNRATLSASLNWLRVLWKTLITPSSSNFESLINEPTASIKQGCIWVTASSTLAALLAALPASQNLPYVFAFFGGIPLILLPSLLVVFIVSKSAVWIGRRLGGTGNDLKMFYGLAIIFSPINVLSIGSFFLPYRVWFLLLVSIYWSALSLLCVTTVHQFTVKKGLIASSVLFVITIFRMLLDFIFLRTA